MRVYMAELINDNGERARHTDDVNLVIFCGIGGETGKVNSFARVAGRFNDQDHRTSGGSPITIDLYDNWVITDLGFYEGDNITTTLITYNVADA